MTLIADTGRSFEQRPAPGAEPDLPGCVKAGQLRPEWRAVDVVEDDPSLRERGAQSFVEALLIPALERHVLGRVALDDGLDVVGKPLPGLQVREQIEADHM